MDCSRLRSVISDALLAGMVAPRALGNIAGGQVENRLQLKWRQHRVLAENTRTDASDVRSGKAISRAANPPAARPGHLNPHSAGKEIDRGRRVVVVDRRILLVVAGDRDH